VGGYSAIYVQGLTKYSLLCAFEAPKLFGFVEAQQSRIQLAKASLPPPRRPAKRSNTSKLYVHLRCAKSTDHSLDAVRQLARELAVRDSIPATEGEIEGAAVLYAFRCAVDAGDLAACELLAPRAFELMREDTLHCVHHRDWAEKLIGASKHEAADAATLVYLEYLQGCDQSALGTQNRILFWAALLQNHRYGKRTTVKFRRVTVSAGAR
jgi:hypothetical protein